MGSLSLFLWAVERLGLHIKGGKEGMKSIYILCAAVIVAVPALVLAAPLTMSVQQGNGAVDSWTPPPRSVNGNVYHYYNTRGDHTTDWKCDWEVLADPDPFVQAFTAVTNQTAVTQTYTVTVSLPIAPPVTPSSLMLGSVAGSITDANGAMHAGSFATIGTSGASPIYTAYIDGVPIQALHNSPFSVTVGTAFDSVVLPAANFGIPVRIPGPAANVSIAIQLKFDLSPGDTASLTSVFDIIVPEPATAGLLMLGAVVFARPRRRIR